MSLNVGVGEHFGEYCGQPIKQTNGSLNKSRVLIQGTNDQAQFVLFQTHLVKSSSLDNAGKGGKKENKRMTRQIDSVTESISTPLGDLKEQIRNIL